jgi:hypothetical protein
VQGLCRLRRLGGGGAERDPWPGAGYLHQRRWRASWTLSALATAWFVAGAVLTPAEVHNQLEGVDGLLLLAAVSASEAGLAVKRVREGT